MRTSITSGRLRRIVKQEKSNFAKYAKKRGHAEREAQDQVSKTFSLARVVEEMPK